MISESTASLQACEMAARSFFDRLCPHLLAARGDKCFHVGFGEQAERFACAATEEGVEVLICGAGVVDGPRGNVARVAGDVALAPVSDADIVVCVVFFLCCACHLHPSLVSELLCEFRANFLPLKHATSMGDLCRAPPLFTIRTLEGDESEWGVPVLIQAEASVVKLLFHSRNGSRKFLVMRFMSVY